MCIIRLTLNGTRPGPRGGIKQQPFASDPGLGYPLGGGVVRERSPAAPHLPRWFRDRIFSCLCIYSPFDIPTHPTSLSAYCSISRPRTNGMYRMYAGVMVSRLEWKCLGLVLKCEEHINSRSFPLAPPPSLAHLLSPRPQYSVDFYLNTFFGSLDGRPPSFSFSLTSVLSVLSPSRLKSSRAAFRTPRLSSSETQ